MLRYNTKNNVTNIMKHNLIEIKKSNYIYLFIYSFFIYQLAITNITNVKKDTIIYSYYYFTTNYQL